MLVHRRQLLATAAWFVAGTAVARASVITGRLPWHPNAGDPPPPVRPGPWVYFSADEAATVEAIADRIIPPDPQTPGGKDSGCGVYIDRQMAGPYGRSEGLYRGAPFQNGTKVQGPQSATTPADQYRKALAELDRHCRSTFGGNHFADLSDADKDSSAARSRRSKSMKFEGVDGKAFFERSSRTCKGISSPIRSTAAIATWSAWKMIGYPRRALQLSRLDRPPQRTLSAAAGQHDRPRGWTPKS